MLNMMNREPVKCLRCKSFLSGKSQFIHIQQKVFYVCNDCFSHISSLLMNLLNDYKSKGD